MVAPWASFLPWRCCLCTGGVAANGGMLGVNFFGGEVVARLLCIFEFYGYAEAFPSYGCPR
jgi:hypothetical protein